MKRYQTLIAASALALFLGGAALTGSVSANYSQSQTLAINGGEHRKGEIVDLTKQDSPEMKKAKEEQAKRKAARLQQENQNTPQSPQAKRPMKAWEKQYYEEHPEQLKKDQKKGEPKKDPRSDDDQFEWHRL